MSVRLTPEARVAVGIAHAIARISASQSIETEHLLLAIMRENPGFLNLFLKTKVTGDPMREVIHQNCAKGVDVSKLREAPIPKRTEEFERVIALAAEEAQRAGREDIGIDHLLIALMREEHSTAARILRERGADIDLVRIQLAAAPYEPPSGRELKLRALSKMVNLLEDSHPSESGKIAEIRNRLECSDGEDATDLSDEVMEIMRNKSSAAGQDTSPGSSSRTTEKVRRLAFFAQFEAKRSGSSEVETGHLLLVILREQKNRFSLFLPLADSKEAVCAEIEQVLRTGGSALSVETFAKATRPPLSEECKRAQAYAQEEADRLWSQRIGSEHLLLGLLREEGSFAARIMRKYGAELEKIRGGLATSSGPGRASSSERLQ
jgi:ATP-dependent Clp protease ATP-binding subunit ClpA